MKQSNFLSASPIDHLPPRSSKLVSSSLRIPDPTPVTENLVFERSRLSFEAQGEGDTIQLFRWD